MPSLLALANLPPIPPCPPSPPASRDTMLCTDGTSFEAAFKDPQGAVLKSLQGALSQVPRGALTGNQTEPGDIPAEQFMGYTLRVAGWRYTEWHPFNRTTATADWGTLVGQELYEHDAPAKPTCQWDFENVNLANSTDPVLMKTKEDLAASLRRAANVVSAS